MSLSPQERPLRFAILQRICPTYRKALFKKLASTPGIELKLIIGQDIPNTKFFSSPDLTGIPHVKLPTRFLRLKNRVLTWHLGLVDELKRFNPDVILCEGESHFIGYLQAFFYRFFYNKRVGLMHWCFYALPGRPVKEYNLGAFVKLLFRGWFDAYIVYSSFSKQCLIELGQSAEKAFVTTNVGDVDKFLEMSKATVETKIEARNKLQLPNRFTVLYVGTLDANKHPDLLLDLAQKLNCDEFNFVLLGSGALLGDLSARATREKLDNVFLPGRVVDHLSLYYRAADVLLIPGRGGIIISEAMAFGLPVIVHQADGTEYDLVEHGVTGIRLQGGAQSDFITALEFLKNNPEDCAKMGATGKMVVENRFTMANMAEQILRAARYARERRIRITTSGEPPISDESNLNKRSAHG